MSGQRPVFALITCGPHVAAHEHAEGNFEEIRHLLIFGTSNKHAMMNDIVWNLKKFCKDVCDERNRTVHSRSIIHIFSNRTYPHT